MAIRTRSCWQCGNLFAAQNARCPKCGWTPGATRHWGGCVLLAVVALIGTSIVLVSALMLARRFRP